MLGILPQYVRDDEDKDIYISDYPFPSCIVWDKNNATGFCPPPPLGSQEPLSESP